MQGKPAMLMSRRLNHLLLLLCEHGLLQGLPTRRTQRLELRDDIRS